MTPGKMITSGAVATVVSAFALYLAQPHFSEAKQLALVWAQRPAAWACFAGIWLGVVCLRNWWGNLTAGMKYGSLGSGGWTLFMFILGTSSTTASAYVLYSIAHASLAS